jgi:iron complex transport system ATP-binding protein
MTALLGIEGADVRLSGRVVVSAAGLEATAGEFIGLVGPNGSGKSSLLRAAAGLAPLAAGRVLVKGRPIEDHAPGERARVLGYLPQMRDIAWSLTVEAVVALGRFAYGAPTRLGAEDGAAIDRALAATRLETLRGRAAHALSGGETARMHLARVLAGETPVLLADEPIAALDPRFQLEIMEILAARARAGALVIAALHDLDLASRYCERLLVMREGSLLADGEPSRVLADDLLSKVFGVVRDARGFRLAAGSA